MSDKFMDRASVLARRWDRQAEAKARRIQNDVRSAARRAAAKATTTATTTTLTSRDRGPTTTKFADCWTPTAAELAEIEARKAEVRADAMARDAKRLGRMVTRYEKAAAKRTPPPAKPREKKTSKYIGVSQANPPSGKTFSARVYHDGKTFVVGCYATEEEAARAREPHARRLGAKLNFPDEA